MFAILKLSMADQKSSEIKDPEKSSDEISLDQIDQFLKEQDPDFTKSLEDIKEVGTDPAIQIESSVPTLENLNIEVEGAGGDSTQKKKKKFGFLLVPFIWFGDKLSLFALRVFALTTLFLKQSFYFLKTGLPEYLGYLKSKFIYGLKRVKILINWFKDLDRQFKVLVMVLILLVGILVVVMRSYLKGNYIPQWGPEVIYNMGDVADEVFEIKDLSDVISLYRVFPQDEIEFLFPKIVVNLKPSPAHSNPMGAFEFFVILDTQDTALEIRARREELHDALQRALESETYETLTGPIGKKRIKELLKKELNDRLTQGWVRDVLIKTMITKP